MNAGMPIAASACDATEVDQWRGCLLKKYLQIAESNYSLFTSTHMPLLDAVMLASYMAWHWVDGRK